MLRVIVLKGLPASGKSSYCKNLIDANPNQYKRINKDDIRAMLDNSYFSKGNEKFVIKVRNQLILMALDAGKHVLIDDTNLNPVHEKDIKALVAGKAVVEIKDFTHVDVETCIARDLKRPVSVGEKVIRKMYNDYLKPKTVSAQVVREHNPKLPHAVLCDLDGTLALFGNKNPYERDFINDEVNKPVKMVLDLVANSGRTIILVSGRNGKFEQETLQWLVKNNIPHNHLLMRKEGDSRKDSVVKKEIFEQEIEPKCNVDFILDDRSQVVSLWRSLGLTCFQVAEGDF